MINSCQFTEDVETKQNIVNWTFDVNETSLDDIREDGHANYLKNFEKTKTLSEEKDTDINKKQNLSDKNQTQKTDTYNKKSTVEKFKEMFSDSEA